MYHKANTKYKLKKGPSNIQVIKNYSTHQNTYNKKNLKEVDTVKRLNTSIRIIPQPKKVKMKIENEKYCGSTIYIKRE